MAVGPGDFPETGPEGVPDVHEIESEAVRCLWLLHVSKESLATRWMSPGEMEAVFRDRYGIHIPRQRIPGLLSSVAGSVTRKRIDGRLTYQVMKPGVDAIGTTSEAVTYVDPDQALSHIRKVEDIFRSRTGVLRVCDPYVDGRTLDYLAEATCSSEIRLLTANIGKPGPLRRDMRAFAQQHGVPLEVRQAAGGLLHDRYVIDDSGMLIFGTSLNSFSRKQSFVINTGTDVRMSVLRAFDAHWSGSPQFT